MTATRRQMNGLLLSHACHARYGDDFVAAALRAGAPVELIVLPADPEARIDAAAAARVTMALFSTDIIPTHSRQFFAAVKWAPNIKWLQLCNAGIDHPVFDDIRARGVRLTTASGANAGPVGLTAVTGMMMLARGFGHWSGAQQRRAWEPLRGQSQPADFEGQTVIVLGMGEIGRVIARHARFLGMHVIGVRRSAGSADDPVDQMCHPGELDKLLPRAQWLVIACPLTPETRGIIDAGRLALLPSGAHLINIARGGIVDEPALIAALESRRLAGAYLDVFAREPLPAASPLWALPNVVVSPHNASASTGNDARVNAIFLRNLPLFAGGALMNNEVAALHPSARPSTDSPGHTP